MSETKSELKVNDKDVVVPGEVLATGMEYLPSFGTYRAGNDILASRLGLVNVEGKVIKLVPLSGKYLPKRGDVIIGRVQEILLSGWRMDTNSAYPAVLPLKDASADFIPRGEDLTKYFDIGDYVMAKITNVTSQNLVDITMRGPGLRKLRGGRLITVNPLKVPRIIGKQGSMVTLIKQYTQCRILVGQNGIVWIQGDDPDMELLTVNVIQKIERESHFAGLTDKVKEYLEKHAKARPAAAPAPAPKRELKGRPEQSEQLTTE
ncbi:MAG: exosome complex protein Rrp4 [Nanoarchaeota archaeon]|nr:exosome complex protein Rrp4 [Nanoarchaeota archaeon]